MSRGFRALLAAALIFSPGLFPEAPAVAEEGATEGITGKVIRDGAGAVGILVEVHLDARGTGARAPVATAVSGEDGSFFFSLSPGKYYVAAKRASSGPGPPMVLEHPENPVPVTFGEIKEISPLDISLAKEGLPPSSGLRGSVFFGGEPVPGAFVMIYDAEAARPVGPRHVSRVESGPDGRFEAPLPPGNYLVAVRKRRRGTAFGPPQPGDLAGEYRRNPVTIADGAFTETGGIPLHVVDLEKLGERLGSLDSPAAEASSIRGQVVDSEGKYVDGLFVFLYRGTDMTGPPVFVTRSGEGGAFVLNAPGPGRYYVIARRAYGTARQPGEELGLVDGSPDSSVAVGDAGSVEGLLLRMGQVR